MTPFLDALQSWRGRAAFEADVSGRGFGVQTVYQKYIVDLCRNEVPEFDVQTYWTEVAREQILSGGMTNSDLRRVPAVTGYRSKFLDKLYDKQARLVGGYPHDSINPCVRKFNIENECDGFVHINRLRPIFAKVKMAEADIIVSKGELFSYLGSNFTESLSRVARLHGFSRGSVLKYNTILGRFAFCAEAEGGLLFFFGLDRDSSGLRHGYIPLEFFIGALDGSYASLNLQKFDIISPGYQYYSVFATAEMACLGLHALVSAFDAMRCSFA